MLKKYDGRTDFYQWDLDQKLTVTDPEVNEVHFCNQTGDCALVCEVYADGEDRLVNVPNILLQEAWPIRAYAFCGCYTKAVQRFEVIARSKPDDYVYTETEIKSWTDLDKRLRVLEAGGIPEPGGGKVNLAFDGEYNAETNKVATVQTVNNAIGNLKVDEIRTSANEANTKAEEAKTDIAQLRSTKQDNLAFDGSYNANTNKVATVQTVTNTVADIVANAPEDFNNLKKLSDWLTTHGGEAAKMNSDIKANADAIAAEVERATEAETELGIRLTAEETRAKAVEEQIKADQPCYKTDTIEAEYSCNSYTHTASINNEMINYHFGRATNKIISLDDLEVYEIQVEFKNTSPNSQSTEIHTISLKGAQVTKLSGGYLIDVAGRNDCPTARVVVVTDTDKFKRICSCALESSGTYLGYRQEDNTALWYTNHTTVKTLRKYSVKKLDNVFLDLENNKYLQNVLGDIFTALDAILAKQT